MGEEVGKGSRLAAVRRPFIVSFEAITMELLLMLSV